MPDLGALQIAGVQQTKPSRFTPLSNQSFFTGLVTQRSPFGSNDNRYNRRFLGGRQDILNAGLNVELSNAATIIRRPGTIAYSTATLDSTILDFYSFKQIKNIANPIDVIADTVNSVYNLTPTSAIQILAKATGAGQSSFLGVGNTLYIGDGIDLVAWQGGSTAAASGFVTVVNTGVVWASGDHFATDGSWVGKTILLGSQAYTIVSVADGSDLTITPSIGGSFADVPYSVNESTRPWGIAIMPMTGASGPNLTTIGTDVPVGGGTVWNNPNFMTFSGEAFSGIVNTNGTYVTWESGDNFNPDGSWTGKTITIATFNYVISSVFGGTSLQLTSSAGINTGVAYSINAPAYTTVTLGPVANGNQGPYNAGTGANDGGGGTAWTNPGNVTGAPDDILATAALGAGASSQGLLTTNYNFSIPGTATVVGVAITAYRQQTNSGTSAVNGTVTLTGTGGSPSSVNDPTWPGSLTPITYGDFVYTWGLSTSDLDPTHVNSSSFGASISATATGSPGTGNTAAVDAVQITVYYTTPTTGQTDLLEATGFNMSYSNQTNLSTGSVSTAGTAVSWVSGNTFMTDGSWIGKTITIGGSPFTILSVTSSTTLVLTAAAGTHAALNYSITTYAQTIAGIAVTIVGYQTYSPTSGWGTEPSLTVQLLKNGSPVGTAKTNQQLPFSPGALTLGGTSDLWGTSWLASDVSASNWGVSIQGLLGTATSATWNISSVMVTVQGTGGPPISVVGTGAFSATTGYQYAIAYGNSSSGALSSATARSVSTGPFNNAAYVAVSLTASPDAQVDQIWVFRTQDGGSTLLNLPTSPYTNTTAVIQDNAPDSSLSITQQAPLAPSNNPPPAGLTLMEYHLNRVWGAVGNTLYYSGGPDVLLGNGAESFPPANSFVFPTKITFLLAAAAGLIVFTQDNIWVINGTSTATFYPSLYLPNVGLLNRNAIDVQGNIWFLYAADRQFITISASGNSELGFAIGDILEASFDPMKAYVAAVIAGTSDKAVFIADGTDSWYRCNWNQAPEGGPAWSPKATITAGFTAMSSIETSPGIYQLMIGRTDRTVAVRAPLLRDPTTGLFVTTVTVGPTTYHYFEDNDVPYSPFFTLGNLVLAQPSQLAEIQSITTELRNTGTAPSIYVAFDEITPSSLVPPGVFEALPDAVNDPPILPASTSVMSNRYYLSQAQDAYVCRHMQIQLNFSEENVANELLTLSVFGALLGHE